MAIKKNFPVKVGVKLYPCFRCPGLSFNEFRIANFPIASTSKGVLTAGVEVRKYE